MNPPTLHKIKSEASRAKILQAAYELFMEQGYHATTMRQIVRRAGITAGGIYNHFTNKEEIWLGVFREHHPWISILPSLEQAQGDTIEELVRDAAQRLIAALGNQSDLFKLMFIELVEFKGQDLPILFPEIMPQLMHFMQKFTLANGRLREFPLPILARAFLGLFFSFYMTEMIIGEQFREMFGESPLPTFVEIYLHGILKEQPGEVRRD